MKLVLSLLFASIIVVVLFVLLSFASGIPLETSFAISIIVFIITFGATYFLMFFVDNSKKVALDEQEEHEKEMRKIFGDPQIQTYEVELPELK